MLHRACRLTVALGCLVTQGALHAAGPRGTAHDSGRVTRLGGAPLAFIENRGQLDARVAYYLQGAGTSAYFTPQGMTLVLKGGGETRWVVKQTFTGARDVVPAAGPPATARIDYFKGPRSGWKTGIRTFESVDYRGLWPGIDLEYAGRADRLEYTFVVQPGSDPRRIRLAYEGATAIAVGERGDLEVSTPVASFHDDCPVAYQDIDGRRLAVDVAFETSAQGVGYGFRVGAYDRSRPLVIDPAVIVYAGYVGGTGGTAGYAIAVHGDSAFLVGQTWATTFPLQTGPDLTSNGGVDAFVAKVKADGTGLEYCGYIGGSDYDTATGVAVDELGAAYVTGYTVSKDFPVKGGLGQAYKGVSFDGFVVKVSPDGSGLEYAGYLGGDNEDRATAIAVDAAGSAYVTGWTVSHEDTFPVKGGPDLTFNGWTDAFVAKIKPDGSGFEYCGYIGGDDTDVGNGIAVDALGHAIVVGSTWSTEMTFPVAGGPATKAPGGEDGFVAKLTADGSGFVYSGYIGGALQDEAYAVSVDALGYAYVAGRAQSTGATFPVKVGPRTTKPDADFDAFIAKVDPFGAIVYAGFVGGEKDDECVGVGVDGAGAAYIAGFTPSAAFEVLDGPQMTFGGDFDGYIAKIKPDGSALEYASYLGGSGFDRAWGIAVSPAGEAYVVGETPTAEKVGLFGTTVAFPVKVGPDLTFNGTADAFVAKFSTQSAGADADLSVEKIAGPDPIVLTGTVVYDIVVTNKGPATATNVVVTDFLPAPLVPGSVLGPAVCNNQPSPLQCTIASLAAGDKAILTMGVKPTAAGPLTNTVMVSASEADLDAANNTATVTTTVTAPTADLSVVKAAFLSPDSIAYQIAVTNNGPADATSVTLVDPIPANAPFAFSPDPQCGPPVAGKVTCAIGSLPAGNIATMTIVLKATGPGQVDNQACASAAEPDPDPGNDCGSASTIVPPPPQPIKKLIVDVKTLVLHGALSPGEGNALIAKLEAAQAQLDRGRTEPARNALGAFVKEVEALQRSRRLDAETARGLIDAARDAIASLRGPAGIPATEKKSSPAEPSRKEAP
jgi:uncharacterized repeat protein (TIGR01451 family)